MTLTPWQLRLAEHDLEKVTALLDYLALAGVDAKPQTVVDLYARSRHPMPTPKHPVFRMATDADVVRGPGGLIRRHRRA